MIRIYVQSVGERTVSENKKKAAQWAAFLLMSIKFIPSRAF